MRARRPDLEGTLVRDGVTIGFDVYHPEGTPTVLLLPTWQLADARHWKAQVPVLARHHRVVTVDARGTGRSDRLTDPRDYDDHHAVADAIAVLDDLGVDRAVVAGVSCGGSLALQLVASHPERVLGAMIVAPSVSLTPPLHERVQHTFEATYEDPQGWALYNERVWRDDFDRFVEFFWGRIFTEPHSSKLIEDGIGWAHETGNEILIATEQRDSVCYVQAQVERMLRELPCPALFVHGTEDAVTPFDRSEVASALSGGDLLVIEGGGHLPQARDPIRVNRAFRELIDRVTPAAERRPRRTTWTRALSRPRKVLYLSSPIGLGHARRDLAIARELRERVDGVQVEWLTQHPVTRFLEEAGETVHQASAELVSESAHFESEAHEHALHAFQAVRAMDEILVANFSVLQDVVEEGDYDLVVGDEAWDVDHFWHENPELKRSAFAWMTDFVGWLPMPEGGDHEAELTADSNAEMLEHVERFARVRDRSIFVGDLEDVTPGSFGPGLPDIPTWTAAHYDFAGYITGFDPPTDDERLEWRERLGYAADRPLVIVSVGGTRAGEALLHKVVAAAPYARKAIDDLQVLVVCGPRIDPATLPEVEGVDVRGFVPDLHLHLAACDAAVVQGGLTTTMELVAARRPFVSFPLANHFEQQRHVRHRLERHGATRSLAYDETDPEAIAGAVVEALNSPVAYRPVPSDGAAKAAGLLAELL